MRSIVVATVLAAPLALALCACAATGPKFSPVSPPEGSAVVYVYRMNHFAMSMSDVHIYLDGKKVFDLANEGYSVRSSGTCTRKTKPPACARSPTSTSRRRSDG
ncbi:MAG: hypothetical protein JOZ72_11240 [Alphaproteobacteria bacterium]|nr:hypothetical protein [Alphaproteobacteria bacterium]